MNNMPLTKEQEEKLREELEVYADLEHRRWAKWQKYFFSKCLLKPQSEVGGMDDRYVYFALPKDLYERWSRQIETPYSELSEQEKESDRNEVRPYFERTNEALTAQRKEIVEGIRGRYGMQYQTYDDVGTWEYTKADPPRVEEILSLPQLQVNEETDETTQN